MKRALTVFVRSAWDCFFIMASIAIPYILLFALFLQGMEVLEMRIGDHPVIFFTGSAMLGAIMFGLCSMVYDQPKYYNWLARVLKTSVKIGK